jgi:hypothetical protein
VEAIGCKWAAQTAVTRALSYIAAICQGWPMHKSKDWLARGKSGALEGARVIAQDSVNCVNLTAISGSQA